MTLFNIGDILTQRYNGTGKPSYKVVDITDTQYIVEQYGSDGILNGNIFTWDFSIIESYHVLYTPPLSPAKGEIVRLDVPASIQHGELVRIDLVVKNIGEMSGTFKLKYYFNGSLVVTSAPWTMASGHQQSAGGQIYFAPTSGTSMTYKVEFMRVV